MIALGLKYGQPPEDAVDEANMSKSNLALKQLFIDQI
jgi:hypothetical protein